MVASADEILRPVRLKLDRAKRHVDNLQREANAFLAKKPYVLVVREDPNLGEGAITIEQKESIPEAIPLILGDAVHNARSALDILAFGLVGGRAPKPWEVQFPFTRNPANLHSTIVQRQINLAGDAVCAAVKALEPYPGGKHGLYELHALDIADKHKIIIVGHRSADLTGNELALMGLPIRGPGVLRFVGRDDLFLYNFPPAPRAQRRAARNKLPDAKQDATVQPRFDLCFAEGEPFAHAPLVGKTRELISLCESVADDLAKKAQ